MKQKTFFVLLIFISTKFLAQENQFSIGSNIPVYYTVGYEEKIFRNIYLNFQFGWIDKPFDKVLNNEAIKRGLNETIADVTFEAFKTGYCFQPVIKYRFKYFYFGGFYSHVKINAENLNYGILADYYGIDIPESIEVPFLGSIPFPDIQADSKSTLYNAGLLIGSEYRFKNPGFAIGLELGFTKILNTKNTLILSDYSEYVPDNVYEDFQNELNTFYTDEGNIWTINVFFIYRFGKSLYGLISKD